jgi:hypothetical protein
MAAGERVTHVLSLNPAWIFTERLEASHDGVYRERSPVFWSVRSARRFTRRRRCRSRAIALWS